MVGMSDRNAKLLAGFGPTDPLIEIGPSYNPVAAKADGWQVTVIDHASQEELVAKYAAAEHVDAGRIEPVDIVWRGEPLHEIVDVARLGGYAGLIASHVIEHVPDLIGFLRSAE